MVVEILINAVDRVPADAAVQLLGSWRRGYPVVAKEQGWNWGTSECLPNFSIVRISDAPDLKAVQDYVTPWVRKTAYTILNHDPASDFFQVHTYADPTTVGVNPNGQVLAAQMHDFLLSWGATEIIDDVNGGVDFKVSAMDALNATGYLNFGQEEEYVIFTETTYDAVSGTHTISCDYSTSTVKPEQMTQALTAAGCDILSRDDVNAHIVFNAFRATMIGYLETAVRKNFDSMIGRAQWYFPADVCNTEFRDMTMAQMTAQLIDIRTITAV